jgi:hypothetical protein
MGSFVLSLSEGWWGSFSLSLRDGGGAHLALEVCVGLRGEEEFHDGGVTVPRGPGERRLPILKERTEREGARRRGGGGAANKNKDTHDEGERGKGKRDRGPQRGTVRFTWGGQGAHLPNACRMRKKNPSPHGSKGSEIQTLNPSTGYRCA